MRIVFAAIVAAAMCGQASAAVFEGQSFDPSPSVLYTPHAYQPYQGGPPAGWIPSPGQQPPPGWVPPAGWVPSAPPQRTIFCQRVDTNLVSCW